MVITPNHFKKSSIIMQIATTLTSIQLQIWTTSEKSTHPEYKNIQ